MNLEEVSILDENSTLPMNIEGYIFEDWLTWQ
jgi:hypothetical protein